MNRQLKSAYEAACDAYANEFCKRHQFPTIDDNDYTYWVAQDHGSILAIGDSYFVDMATIRTDIDEDAPVEEFAKWYEHDLSCHDLNLPTLNFHSWLHGAPRVTQEKIEYLRSLKEKFERVCEVERNKVTNKSHE